MYQPLVSWSHTSVGVPGSPTPMSVPLVWQPISIGCPLVRDPTLGNPSPGPDRAVRPADPTTTWYPVTAWAEVIGTRSAPAPSRLAHKAAVTARLHVMRLRFSVALGADTLSAVGLCRCAALESMPT